MKKLLPISFLAGFLMIVILSLTPIVSAQLTNGGFETGDFTGWTTNSQAVINSPSTDPYILSLNKVHDGLYAAQIGDDYSVCPGDPDWDSWIEQSATVGTGDILSFWYAVVTSGAHASGEAAGFILTVTVGGVEVFRSTNEAYTSPSYAPGWIWSGSIGYYPWTQVTLDLSAYVGQTVTLRFLVHDCIYCAHWAYGYLDGIAVAPPYTATIDAYCNTEASAVPVAITMDGTPTGFDTPHTFSITGTHTFTVPSSDANGHPFAHWSTGETSTTVVVTSAGTYTAYYARTPTTVPDFPIQSLGTVVMASLMMMLVAARRLIFRKR